MIKRLTESPEQGNKIQSLTEQLETGISQEELLQQQVELLSKILKEQKTHTVRLDRLEQLQKENVPKTNYLAKIIGGGLDTLTLIILIAILGTLLFGLPVRKPSEIQLVDCQMVKDEQLVNSGWRVAAAYSYSTGNNYTGYTVYNICVIER